MEKSFPVTEKVMDMINRYTIDPLKPEDVFCFSLTLCDNDIDRDNERFSDRALSELAKLFVGKTGIFDHDPTSSGQTARIFSTALVTDDTRLTLDGKPYSSDAIKNYDLVVLNVWAEWCGPCVWELPFLQKIYENYKNVLVLGLWWGDSVEEALETANEAGVKYPLIHSTDALDKYLRASKYIPHTIFFRP